VARDARIDFDAGLSQDFVAAVLDRWRGVNKGDGEAPPLAPRLPPEQTPAQAAPVRQGLGLDPDRFKLLKKSPADRV
jgi:hypothetical protein